MSLQTTNGMTGGLSVAEFVHPPNMGREEEGEDSWGFPPFKRHKKPREFHFL